MLGQSPKIVRSSSVGFQPTSPRLTELVFWKLAFHLIILIGHKTDHEDMFTAATHPRLFLFPRATPHACHLSLFFFAKFKTCWKCLLQSFFATSYLQIQEFHESSKQCSVADHQAQPGALQAGTLQTALCRCCKLCAGQHLP